VIIGAGGFSRETAAAVDAIDRAGGGYTLLGFADDNPALEGQVIDGVPVLGPVGAVLQSHPSAQLTIGVGRPDNYFSRARIVERLGLPADRYATIVHPAASVARTARLGPGTVVLAGTVVTAAADIGAHVVVMPAVVVTHDDVISDYATLTSGVLLGGSVRVGLGAYLGAGTLVRQDLRVGDWSMTGMGSLVTRDIPDGQRWYGSPARYQSDVDVPPDLIRPTG
jgi:sugar O-acyltransferase (sialic acid O-acetyltransferase NeuD family)